MCVGITPPCSKCGAPARYRHQQRAADRTVDRLLDAIEWINENMNDDCPARAKLLEILER